MTGEEEEPYKNKKNGRRIVGTVMVLVSAGPHAALADMTTLPAHATVLRPVALANPVSLDFGQMTSAGINGTVTVNPNGTTSNSAGIDTVSGTTQAGRVDISALSQMAITVALTPVPLTLAGPAAVDPQVTAAFVRVREDVGGANNVLVATVSVGAGQSFSFGAGVTTGQVDIGGRLRMPPALVTPGVYSGTLTITATYN